MNYWNKVLNNGQYSIIPPDRVVFYLAMLSQKYKY